MKFLNMQLQQYAHNSSSNNFRDQLKAWSKLIGFWWLWPVNQHNSKLTIELLKDFDYNKNVIMVSQPHNSEVTIDNLQVLKPTIQIN